MGRLARPWFIALCAVAILAAGPTAASGQDSSPDGTGCPDGAGGSWSPRGRQTLSLAAGFGVGLPIGPARGSDLEDVRFGALLPRWSIGVSDCVGRGSWYRGAVSLAIEGIVMYDFEPHSGVAGGLTPLLHYEFFRKGRLIPYVEAGVGVIFTDLDLDQQDDGLNFTPQAGLGIRYELSERTEFIVGWRFHHISNAGLRDPNTGLDSSLFLLGMSYHFDR